MNTKTVALVTGASRGIGRGIALAFLAKGMTVHVTGRTVTDAQASVHPQLEGSLDGLRAEAKDLPGELIIQVCDHADDRQTEAAVASALSQSGKIDILVNNAWPGYESMVEGDDYTWERPFWEQPVWRWDAMVGVALRTSFVASRAAAPNMIARKTGLIVNISFWAAQKHHGNAIYGIAKAGTDKMSSDFAHELRPHGVTAVSLYPGLVRTEAVMRNAEYFDMSNSESPQFVGLAISALWADPNRLEKSGKVHVTAGLAREYGFVDIDGKKIIPATLGDF
ncbi:SDR family NAD(P)-dependent oxidoreductase [Devosia sp.]|uniref:SDR family NAD(P)-dependent oxidoreductase n=1 Tax=Devosia sp. TaxID=1871048 RepID=UPI0025DB78B0|nr:SDR family NAD(P)-dependent oxidoreductase [Devosia sp.]MCR6634261.1 SDR family NAD(P)-dependent oxidoreductase [Devosia sp.]